jgi:REP element-mobilizing transposase RayT
MAHAYARIYIHLIFGTNRRRHCLRGETPSKLWAYIRGVAREYAVDILEINGGDDHVHILFCLPPKLSLANVVRVFKANSSKWLNETGHFFAWQQGYAAFSVSSSNLDGVKAYIQSQPEHHRKRDFEAEYVAFLKKNGIKFTPERVFA